MSYEDSELAERVSNCNKITNSICIVESHYLVFPTSNYTVHYVKRYIFSIRFTHQ